MLLDYGIVLVCTTGLVSMPYFKKSLKRSFSDTIPQNHTKISATTTHDSEVGFGAVTLREKAPTLFFFLTKLHSILGFCKFSQMLFFCPRVPSGYHVHLVIISPRVPTECDGFLDFPCFEDFDTFEEYLIGIL